MPENVEGVSHCRDQLFGHHGRALLLIDVGRQDRELVPADPGDDIGFPDAPHQPLGGLNQQFVAGLMPQTVVDPLEAIQVQQKQGEAFPGPADLLQALAKLFAEQRPVRDLGQHVVLRQPTVALLAHLRTRQGSRQLALGLRQFTGKPLLLAHLLFHSALGLAKLFLLFDQQTLLPHRFVGIAQRTLEPFRIEIGFDQKVSDADTRRREIDIPVFLSGQKNEDAVPIRRRRRLDDLQPRAGAEEIIDQVDVMAIRGDGLNRFVPGGRKVQPQFRSENLGQEPFAVQAIDLVIVDHQDLGRHTGRSCFRCGMNIASP